MRSQSVLRISVAILFPAVSEQFVVREIGGAPGVIVCVGLVRVSCLRCRRNDP